MNTPKINPRKFKDFYGEHLATIGNYQQDLKTGELLAVQLLDAMEAPQDYPELAENTHLKKLLKRLPNGTYFTNHGLLIGLFTTISRYLEPILKQSPLIGTPCSQPDLLNFLTECQEYQEHLRTRVRRLIQQWSINLSYAVNNEHYTGMERYHLSGLVLELPTNLSFLNDHYACFCYELTLLLKKLLQQKEASQ